ncbi:hypothetical protein V7S43_018441 [Phytophthora oleae]|uniref:Crinkler effector protein N-terminal domain-containing protein n=1 Tax=Phytophthora oleae TaxID=2107226 RepID=A0ABD3ESK3_9STRA
MSYDENCLGYYQDCSYEIRGDFDQRGQYARSGDDYYGRSWSGNDDYSRGGGARYGTGSGSYHGSDDYGHREGCSREDYRYDQSRGDSSGVFGQSRGDDERAGPDYGSRGHSGTCRAKMVKLCCGIVGVSESASFVVYIDEDASVSTLTKDAIKKRKKNRLTRRSE